jgi:phosphoribosylcarboxyaminoimidazole (NCAIR) mutase
VSNSNYFNLFLQAGISNSGDQEKYSRRLDAVLAHEGITAGDIVGVGERGTGGNLDLYVIHRQAIALVSERGVFNKRIEVQSVAPIASIARLKGTQEGFKGTELTITAIDANAKEVFKIVWGLGGPDWVGPLVERQRQHLFDVISKAMDQLADAPARTSVFSASSKADALKDWAADVVKAAGVSVTSERVEEHANMIAAVTRMFVFLPLARLEDLKDFYPDGEMPSGTPIATFDELYGHVVARVGSAQAIDQGIDECLAGAWSEYVRGCREQYA